MNYIHEYFYNLAEGILISVSEKSVSYSNSILKQYHFCAN